MLTHIMFGCDDVAAARAFYDAVLGALGVPEGRDAGARVFYMHSGGVFGIGKPINGEPATSANGGTLGFVAPDKAAVDAFHAAGLAHGGTCEGAPGHRPAAPNNAYGAYLRDPTGNKICAFAGMNG